MSARRKSSLLVLLAVVFCGGPIRAQETPLEFQNGGFETVNAQRKPVGWKCQTDRWRMPEVNPHEGKRCLQLLPSSTVREPYIAHEQRISVKPGTYVNVRGWVRVDGDPGDPNCQVGFRVHFFREGAGNAFKTVGGGNQNRWAMDIADQGWVQLQCCILVPEGAA